MEQALVEKEIYLANEEATVALGAELGKVIPAGAVIFLDGTLGAGKTTFCRGVLHSFDYSGPVKSPTYTLVEPYELAQRTIYHFDLYRLGDPEELEYMGIRDYFSAEAICLIEWFEKGEGVLPQADILVKVVPKGEGRSVTLCGLTTNGMNWVNNINN